jgi:hypothetical protein
MALSDQRRDRFRRIAFRYRSKPGDYGLRQHTVEIVDATWSGSFAGEGTKTQTVLALVERTGQPPKVRWLKEDEIALGNLAQGTIEIGPITPDCSAGGIPIDTLMSATLAVGGTHHLRITGPQHTSGAFYKVTFKAADHALHWTLRAEPVAPANL